MFQKQKILKFSAIAFFTSLCLMSINTFIFIYINKQVQNVPKTEIIRKELAINNLEGALNINTISKYPFNETDFTGFENFIKYLKKTYPLIFTKCEFKRINNWALLFHIKSKNPNTPPIVLTAHYDTVLFGDKAYHDNKYIYGNGAIDDKSSLIAIMEAINNLLMNKYTPKRDIYLAFGCDEEVGGENGAKKIVDYFKANKIKPDLILDEGQPIFKTPNGEIAIIGIGGKGGVEAKITTFSKGGHALMPQKISSVTLLADAIKKMTNNPPEPIINNLTKNYLNNNASNFDFITNFLIANKFILKPLLIKKLQSNTTFAVNTGATASITMLSASEKRNIIPDKSSFIVDFRILPNQDEKYILSYLDKLYKGNNHIKYEAHMFAPPQKISSVNSTGLKKVQYAISTVFQTNSFPYIFCGGGDARLYTSISNNIYQFLPIKITSAEYGLMHSKGEYISIENFYKMITFYQYLIQNYDN